MIRKNEKFFAVMQMDVSGRKAKKILSNADMFLYLYI